jgi:hypothetical protein
MGLRRAVLHDSRGALAAAAALLFALGVAGAMTVDPSSAPQRVQAAGPPSSTAPAEELETVDEASTTTVPPVTVAAPTTTVAAAPAKPRTTTTAAPKTSRDASYPGGVSFPFQAGRTSWSGTSNRFDMAISVDNPRPKNGEPVTYTLTLANAVQKCCWEALVFGDGGPFHVQQGDCPNNLTAPGTVTKKVTRSYNKPGRWQFTLTGLTGDCHPDPGAQTLNGYLYGWIEVLPGGQSTSQGPSLPTFKSVGTYGPTPHDDDPSYVSIIAQVTDVDGYISKLVIDYGDGASETIPEKDMGCRQSEGGWPEQSFMQTPNNPPPTHQYANRGTYTVSVTAYSQGCDGRDVQQATGSFQVTY